MNRSTATTIGVLSFFFSSRRRHTRCSRDWSSDVCSSDLANVFLAMYQAETRKGPEGVLDASQRVPREAMLYAYTRNSARAMNEQDIIGSVTPGKQADLVLLDRDVLTVPAEELKDTKVIWTMVGGKTVYHSN